MLLLRAGTDKETDRDPNRKSNNSGQTVANIATATTTMNGYRRV
jgi:hypothetical protein